MRKALKQKKVLHVLLGFLIASSGYLYFEYRYEQKVLEAFINSVYHTKDLNKYDDKAVVLAAMNKTHLQMQQKDITAMDLQISEAEKFITSPLMTFALTKDGACGGNSLVLTQILDGMGYNVRPGHMFVNSNYGGHIIVEVELNNKWVALDPLYNLAYTNPNGELASFSEINANWDYYKLQTPSNYNHNYKFEGIRYTNWDKIPLLGSLTQSTIGLFAGKAAMNNFSARKHILNPKKILFFLSIYLLGFSFLSILNRRYLKIHLPRFSFKSKAIPKPSAA